MTPAVPVIFKGAASHLPAFSAWTDEYLKSKFGHERVTYEVGKKERRSDAERSSSLEHFISIYESDDVYMVQDLSEKMRDDITLLPFLRCRDFESRLLKVTKCHG